MYKFHLQRQKAKWGLLTPEMSPHEKSLTRTSQDSDYERRPSQAHVQFAITGDEGMTKTVMIHQATDQHIDMEETSEAIPEGQFTSMFHDHEDPKAASGSLPKIHEDQQEGSDSDSSTSSPTDLLAASVWKKAGTFLSSAERHRRQSRRKSFHKLILSDFSTPNVPYIPLAMKSSNSTFRSDALEMELATVMEGLNEDDANSANMLKSENDLRMIQMFEKASSDAMKIAVSIAFGSRPKSG